MRRFFLLGTVLLFIWVSLGEGAQHFMDKLSPLLKNIVFQPKTAHLSAEISKRTPNDQNRLNIWVFFDTKFPSQPPHVQKRENLLNDILSQLDDNVKRRRAKTSREIVDETDLPVPSEYISQVLRTGIIPRVTSNWLNAMSCTLTHATEQLEALAKLPFVTHIDIVHSFRRTFDSWSELEISDNNSSLSKTNQDVGTLDASFQHRGEYAVNELNYGDSYQQLEMLNVPAAHRAGYNGDGVTILVLDSGFYKNHEVFSRAQIVDEWDFVQGDNDTQDGPAENRHSHGTMAFSNVGGNVPGKLFGPAYRSRFLLAKTEDVASETPIEEDNFVAALEWGEKRGADIATASLGYDDWIHWRDLNGMKAVSTRGVNIAINKGMIIVVAAGNSGQKHKQIPVPADALEVISVGAVDSNRNPASFSAWGPTFDGRIKPEVAALGVNNFVATTNSPTSYGRASGTSFATPLVAGVAALVLQAHPDWTNRMVREALLKTATTTHSPNLRIGWGIVNAAAAINYLFPMNQTDCFRVGCVCDEAHYNMICDARRLRCSEWCEHTCSEENVCMCNGGGGRCTPGLIKGWKCADRWYHRGDAVCNCECGLHDPDCDDEFVNSTVGLYLRSNFQIVGCPSEDFKCISGQCVPKIAHNKTESVGCRALPSCIFLIVLNLLLFWTIY